MYVDARGLSLGKSENDAQSNEDMWAIRPGIFAIADGAGSMYRSGEWARFLIEYFAENPLMSANRFEVRWWLEQVQMRYQQQPRIDIQDWKIQQKAERGGASTLAAIVITSVRTGSAKACLIALGDSCIFRALSGTHTVESFPLQSEADFLHSPFCFPSVPGEAYALADQIRVQQIEIRPGDRFLLATDAVARWLLSSTGRERWENFHALAAMNEQTWSSFVYGCRDRGGMVDDDSTLLSLAFSKKGERKLAPASPMPFVDPFVKTQTGGIRRCLCVGFQRNMALCFSVMFLMFYLKYSSAGVRYSND